METETIYPGSPGTPLMQASPERVNQGRQDSDGAGSPLNRAPNGWGRHSRDSSVHEKVAQFNSLAMQSKALERKTHDAALKRAMLGREEAEAEMRRYRGDVQLLRQQIQEGQDRERRVGERLEEVMERYARAKETFNNTKTVWEKEIRKARKEAFKSQSQTVQAQEEVKSARDAMNRVQTAYDEMRRHHEEREQENFSAKYQLVEVQEKLEKALQNIKLVEQERDALKTIAKNEEIARIAAEGQIPLPPSKDNDEFATPRKPVARPSFVPAFPVSEDAKQQIEELRRELLWERQKANRAHEQVDFLLAQCDLRCCPCKVATPQSIVPEPLTPVSETGFKEVGEETIEPAETRHEEHEELARSQQHDLSVQKPQEEKQDDEDITITVAPRDPIMPVKADSNPSTPTFSEDFSLQVSAGQPTAESGEEEHISPRERETVYARTPSCEPPSSATRMVNMSHSNASLQSLLDAPIAPPSPSSMHEVEVEAEPEYSSQPYQTSDRVPTYHTIFTTTRIPLAGADDDENTNSSAAAATMPHVSSIFSPTMTREEALAQIQERRGRARSLAQGTLTPRKQMVEGTTRRDISAPSLRNTPARGRSRSRPRAQNRT